MAVKSPEQMQEEVRALYTAAGWRSGALPFAAAAALLHEAAAKVTIAWLEWGKEDGTTGVTAEHPEGGWRSVPRGIGAEFAGVLVALLDFDDRYQLGMLPVYRASEYEYAWHDHFLGDVNVLHTLIARLPWVHAMSGDVAGSAAEVLGFLVQLARHERVNLTFEFDRRMKYLGRRRHEQRDDRGPWLWLRWLSSSSLAKKQQSLTGRSRPRSTARPT